MEKRTKIILVLLFLAFGLLINVVSSNYLSYLYKNQKQHSDILLDTIDGNYIWAMRLAEIILLITIVIFIRQLIKNKENIPEQIFIIALFELIRGLLLPMTLLAPLDSHSFFNSFKTFSYGLFPSGHIAIPFLFFLFSYKKSRLCKYYLIATLLIGFLLILGKQHYTIDILTSIFIAYSIKCFSDRNIFKKDGQ